MGKFVDTGFNSGYTFIDNKASILAVAHLDWVQGITKKKQLQITPPVHFTRVGNDDFIFSRSLDDRLGVFIILEILINQLGMKMDVLLTEDEEIGMSTASEFKTDKNYNWIFSFDRRGEGLVMYDYETKELATLMTTVYDLPVAFGSFSDICKLDTLGCKGFNFGTAYFNEHTDNCMANMTLVSKQIRKFKKFYRDYKNIHLDHVAIPRYRYSGTYANYNWKTKKWDDYYTDDNWARDWGYGAIDTTKTTVKDTTSNAVVTAYKPKATGTVTFCDDCGATLVRGTDKIVTVAQYEGCEFCARCGATYQAEQVDLDNTDIHCDICDAKIDLPAKYKSWMKSTNFYCQECAEILAIPVSFINNEMLYIKNKEGYVKKNKKYHCHCGAEISASVYFTNGACDKCQPKCARCGSIPVDNDDLDIMARSGYCGTCLDIIDHKMNDTSAHRNFYLDSGG